MSFPGPVSTRDASGSIQPRYRGISSGREKMVPAEVSGEYPRFAEALAGNSSDANIELYLERRWTHLGVGDIIDNGRVF